MTKHELDNSRWWERAACIGYPIDLFVAKPGIVGNRANQRAKDARAVCAGCDVSEGCLIAALYEGDRWAIRGGLLPNQRAGLAVKYGIRAQIKHGTEAGAQAHRRNNEKPCAACQFAASQADVRRRSA